MASTLSHRVIVPVYVPNDEGYFENAQEILRLCLESLCVTTQGRASITVVSNACMPAIVDVLQVYRDAGRIDQLVVNTRNWGKVDSAMSACRGRFEDLVTISDADVLFLPGWLDALEDVFRAFPECAFATPAPNPSLAYLYTSSTLLSAIVTREFGFESLIAGPDLDRFGRSIGRPESIRPEQRAVQMRIRRNGVAACIGGGHFVFTMRRDLVWRLPRRPCLTGLRSGAEADWFDLPPDAHGLWRLSATPTYAHHMGNIPEPWMYDELERCRTTPVPPARPLGPLPRLQPSRLAMIPLSWRTLGARAARKYFLDPRWRAAGAATSPGL